MESRPHDEPLLPRVGLLDKWRQLQGLDPQDASRKYMQLICRWSGYGSTIFDVLSTDSRIPRELWLGVSAEAVSIYLRGEKVPIDSLQYERIASFGVPSNKLYRLQVDNRELLFKTTQGEEINKLINAYINTIVKNRSFCSGTSASTG